MGTFVMMKASCLTCGAVNNIELLRKHEPILCYYVKCKFCGRESAKHTTPEEAIRDWNHQEAEHEETERSD